MATLRASLAIAPLILALMLTPACADEAAYKPNLHVKACQDALQTALSTVPLDGSTGDMLAGTTKGVCVCARRTWACRRRRPNLATATGPSASRDLD